MIICHTSIPIAQNTKLIKFGFVCVLVLIDGPKETCANPPQAPSLFLSQKVGNPIGHSY